MKRNTVQADELVMIFIGIVVAALLSFIIGLGIQHVREKKPEITSAPQNN